MQQELLTSKIINFGGFFMPKNKKDVQARADEKRAGQRTRNWTVIFYPEDLPENWIELINALHFRWAVSPLHNKDINANGEPKKAHYHALFMFESIKTQEQVIEALRTIFGANETGAIIGAAIPQRVNDRSALIRYFAHLDNPEKALYDVNEIKGYNGVDIAELLKYSATETREMVVAMEEFIESNDITELCDFAKMIRYENTEWHTILTTKMTMYFNAFIKSRKFKSDIKINKSTGEVI